MRDGAFLPAIVIGFLAGWLTRSLVADPSVSAGNVMIALVVVSMGWWVQWTVRKQAELDRVPIDSVAKLYERLDDLIVQCLDPPATDPIAPALLQQLRLLSNEISWLGTVVQALDTATGDYERLQQHYYDFKTRLTGGPEVETSAAAEIGRSMRTCCLRIRWKLCKRILERPGDIGPLGGSD